MRIFIAVRHSTDPRYFHGGLWSANFYPALRQLGHELVESQVDLLPTSRFMSVPSGFTREETEMRARTTDRILEEVRLAQNSGPIDLFLSYFYNSHFDPGGFDELRRFGVPSVNFYCNSIHQFDLVAAIASKVDFAWHAERDARKLYVDAGATPIWVQMAADPMVYYPILEKQRQQKAVFVGQRYADRDRWLAALARVGLPIEIYGAGWKQEQESSVDGSEQEPPYLGRRSLTPGSFSSYANHVVEELRCRGLVQGIRRLRRNAAYVWETRSAANILRHHLKGSATDVSSVFAAYEVCLNFSNVWSDGRPGSPLVSHVRLRDFEGPMSRTCYLTGHTDEITEFYKVGQEIDTYRSPDELIDKTRYYLAHPPAAENLRDAGYRRALRDHTWKRRFEELFSQLGLAKPRQALRQIV